MSNEGPIFVYILKEIKVLNILEFIDLKIPSAAKSSREKQKNLQMKQKPQKHISK